jgi:hypothetical protein
MKDLNLGPDSKRLVDQFRKLDRDQRTIESKADETYSLACQMTNMLERWMTIAWCWPDNCPAQICSGPHVRVKYHHESTRHGVRPIEVIEPYNHIGERFPGVPYTIIKEDKA